MTCFGRGLFILQLCYHN